MSTERGPKRVSKEWRKYGKIAEWMVVRDGLTLEEIVDTGRVVVSIEALQLWSSKYGWQEKRRRFERKPWTAASMAYDILYALLMDGIQQQQESGEVSLSTIQKLEKLVKVYKQLGMPFAEQVANVMRVFMRFIENKTAKGSVERSAYLEFVRDFIHDVEGGFIQPE